MTGDRTVTFDIDPQTGAMTVDIHGVVGPACDDVQKLIEACAGNAREVTKKPSYYQHVARVGRVGQ